ncbi:MAG: family protein phosphatase [Acidobacteriota bacterium]|jgi:protein phosphatase|nr:family protein phosphatase [Acidobacteriota bacterium]
MSEQPAETTAVSTGRLAVEAALRTDVGLVRSENQDFGTVTTPEEERDSHPGGRLLVVADGMGGHRGGATASKIAGETVKAQYLGSETTDIAAAIHDALLRANARIYSEAQANPDLRGMGTTTSALVIRDGQGWFGHVGDSRIYLVRGDEIRQLTDDHSLVASMVREGLLTSKEAETHPRRNVLQRSMGVSEEVDIDVRGPLDVQEGDTYILCSDGLHGVVKEPELKEVAKLSIDRAADEFVKLAMERGAPDNVTVIVARVVRSIDGDDTVVDRPRAAVAEALDETQRDTDRIPIIPVEESPAVPSDILAPEPPAIEILGDDTVETKKPEPEATSTPVPNRGGGIMKWFLLAVAALGAAGAWFFLSR